MKQLKNLLQSRNEVLLWGGKSHRKQWSLDRKWLQALGGCGFPSTQDFPFFTPFPALSQRRSCPLLQAALTAAVAWVWKSYVAGGGFIYWEGRERVRVSEQAREK